MEEEILKPADFWESPLSDDEEDIGTTVFQVSTSSQGLNRKKVDRAAPILIRRKRMSSPLLNAEGNRGKMRTERRLH